MHSFVAAQWTQKNIHTWCTFQLGLDGQIPNFVECSQIDSYPYNNSESFDFRLEILFFKDLMEGFKFHHNQARDSFG